VNHDRRWIERHIPQQGSMCLLDEVLSWDRQHVLCRSRGHRSGDHPLRGHDRLGSACAIEYAAQAAAVHGALMAAAAATSATSATRFGMLASARAVELAVARLDEAMGDLLVRVNYLHGDAASALYEFSISEQRHGAAARDSATTPLAQGRLSLWLDAPIAPERTP
jgi:predicted hotdog family 3-hydroxylacyl-ACP dehydratase